METTLAERLLDVTQRLGEIRARVTMLMEENLGLRHELANVQSLLNRAEVSLAELPQLQSELASLREERGHVVSRLDDMLTSISELEKSLNLGSNGEAHG